MAEEYLTSQTDLPDNPHEEIIIQVTEKATREIFRTRANVSRNPDDLDDPDPLTVVRGPHENIHEDWFIEINESGLRTTEAIDRELLHSCYQTVRNGSNVVNTRSDDVKTLLQYYVEIGKYESLSDAIRSLLLDSIAAEDPELLDMYVEVKIEHEKEQLSSRIKEDSDGSR